MDQANIRPCPFCAEPIRPGAIKCRYCKEDLEPGWSSARGALLHSNSMDDDRRPRVELAGLGTTGPTPPAFELQEPIAVKVVKDTTGMGVGRGVTWILGLLFLIGWIPVVGGFVAGVVGGKKSGGVMNGLMASIIPSLILANVFLAVTAKVQDIPVIGMLATFGAVALAFAGLAPVVLGALVGGLITDDRGMSVSIRGAAIVLMAGLALGYRVVDQVRHQAAGAVATAQRLDTIRREGLRGKRSPATPATAISPTGNQQAQSAATGEVPNVAGSWTYNIVGTPSAFTATLTRTGRFISGTLDRGPVDSWSLSGTIQGNSLTMNFVTNLKTGDTRPDYYHTGTVSADGKTIRGTVIWRGGSGTWVMER